LGLYKKKRMYSVEGGTSLLWDGPSGGALKWGIREFIPIIWKKKTTTWWRRGQSSGGKTIDQRTQVKVTKNKPAAYNPLCSTDRLKGGLDRRGSQRCPLRVSSKVENGFGPLEGRFSGGAKCGQTLTYYASWSAAENQEERKSKVPQDLKEHGKRSAMKKALRKHTKKKKKACSVLYIP